MADGKKMSQSDVLNHFAEKFRMKKADAKAFFEEVVSLATSEVQSKGEFGIPGLGKLVLSQRKAREGRNPATGATITIPAKTTLKFKLSKPVKDSVVSK
jgi:DNA-binding protein HU-beta